LYEESKRFIILCLSRYSFFDKFVDRNVIPLGTPVWLQTTWPNEALSPFNKLMLAQDTGGAIKGHVRADMFWGRDDEAEKMAGLMKQKGQLFVLLPKGYSIK